MQTIVRKTYSSAPGKGLPRVEFNASSDEGLVEALVSVFGNVDLQGDRVVKGAFTESLSKWRASGDPIPVVFSHDWQNPMAHIGRVVSAHENERGLVVKYQLDIDTNPVAAHVFRLLKERRIREHSFAYDVLSERPGGDGANELVNLDIIEVGPTLRGANPATELFSVKGNDGRGGGRSPLPPSEDLDSDIARIEAHLEEARRSRLDQESVATAIVKMAPQSVDDLRKSLATQYGAEFVRETLGPTREERDAHARTKAEAIASLSLPPGTKSTRLVSDAQHRVVYDERDDTPSAQKARAHEEFERARLEAEGPIRLQVSMVSKTMTSQPRPTLTFDPRTGRLRADDPNIRLPVGEQEDPDGTTYRMPILSREVAQ